MGQLENQSYSKRRFHSDPAVDALLNWSVSKLFQQDAGGANVGGYQQAAQAGQGYADQVGNTYNQYEQDKPGLLDYLGLGIGTGAALLGAAGVGNRNTQAVLGGIAGAGVNFAQGRQEAREGRLQRGLGRAAETYRGTSEAAQAGIGESEATARHGRDMLGSGIDLSRLALSAQEDERMSQSMRGSGTPDPWKAKFLEAIELYPWKDEQTKLDFILSAYPSPLGGTAYPRGYPFGIGSPGDIPAERTKAEKAVGSGIAATKSDLLGVAKDRSPYNPPFPGFTAGQPPPVSMIEDMANRGVFNIPDSAVDTRNAWERNAPNWLGGEDAPERLDPKVDSLLGAYRSQRADSAANVQRMLGDTMSVGGVGMATPDLEQMTDEEIMREYRRIVGGR